MENLLDDDLSCFRIRSTRRRKRARIDDYDKMLLRLERECDALYQQIRSLGWTELKPPVQRGYIRFFVLCDDVQKSKRAAFYEGILKQINTVQWSDNRGFRRKKTRKQLGKKVYAIRKQELYDLQPSEFDKLSKAGKIYFYPRLTYSKQHKKPYTVYRFTEPWRFVLRVQPDMITKIRIKDFAIERERDRILKILQHPSNRRRLQRIQSGNAFHWDGPETDWYKDPLHNRSLHDILNEYWTQPTMTISITNPRDNEGFLFYFSQLSVVCGPSTVDYFAVAFTPHYDVNTPAIKNLFHRPFGKEINHGTSSDNRSQREKRISKWNNKCVRHIP